MLLPFHHSKDLLGSKTEIDGVSNNRQLILVSLTRNLRFQRKHNQKLKYSM